MDRSIFTNTAALAALIAAVGWIANKAYDIATKRLEKVKARRSAIIRFYVDIKLRNRAVKTFLQRATEGREHLVDVIARHDAEKKPFRLYGVQISDLASHDLIDAELATFNLQTAELVREVILLDRQMVALYEKLGSGEFEALSADRKVQAIDNWLESLRELHAQSNTLLVTMSAWPELDQAKRRLPRLPKSGSPVSERKNDRAHDSAHSTTSSGD